MNSNNQAGSPGKETNDRIQGQVQQIMRTPALKLKIQPLENSCNLKKFPSQTYSLALKLVPIYQNGSIVGIEEILAVDVDVSTNMPQVHGFDSAVTPSHSRKMEYQPLGVNLITQNADLIHISIHRHDNTQQQASFLSLPAASSVATGNVDPENTHHAITTHGLSKPPPPEISLHQPLKSHAPSIKSPALQTQLNPASVKSQNHSKSSLATQSHAQTKNNQTWAKIDLTDPARLTAYTPISPQPHAECCNGHDQNIIFTSLQLLAEPWAWPNGDFGMDLNHEEFVSTNGLAVQWPMRSASGSNGRGSHIKGSITSETIWDGKESKKYCKGSFSCSYVKPALHLRYTSIYREVFKYFDR
ncbi:hypothetical protein K435DRAFT_806072 [Dendrothele bispora CBS 962.96]|uniref:Uncharacterized protein n=1 Tax=Dendrothele bispora (strain CBS 962.96) TaxID=1314807 RepID=A0A4S8L9P2_DENBC|nr:hypothetical protein K435DRAFT_806072 [Dendrothele bispora CBS 962.96]